jgi:NTP pyrophosphatase (non-canonical NTP hydrolase)
MNKPLFDFVKMLSRRDTKTLSQKALKLAEECGELAKYALSYDGAFATNHRFSTRQRILEESVDCMLVALSVAYDLNFSDDEIEAMMFAKSSKWATLQNNELDLCYPVPFEIHITVDMNTTDANYELLNKNFNSVCTQVQAKPIRLDLQNNNGDKVMHDIMTSSRHMGTNRSAYEESERVCAHLTTAGYNVVRTKIETVPWHPAAPQNEGDIMPKHCYFESHVGIVIPQHDTLSNLSKIALKDIADHHNAHLSSNIFKKLVDGQSVIMLTYRAESDFKTFDANMKLLLAELDMAEFQYQAPIMEFSVYDTKVHHDAEWIKGVYVV